MNAFCASESLLAFIVLRSPQPRENDAENSSFKRSSFVGADQKEGLIYCTDYNAGLYVLEFNG